MEILNRLRTFLIMLLLAGYSINAFPQNVQATIDAFKASYQYEGKKEYTRAIETIKAVYEEKSYEMNLRLGWLTYLSGSQNESLTYYKRAMELKPYAIEPCLGFAQPASKLGMWDDILIMYNRILTIDPNNTAIHYAKGLILYNRGDYQNAEINFEKIVNLYPFDYDGLHMLAWTKLNLKKTGEAKILFQKALLNQPDNESDTQGLALIK